MRTIGQRIRIPDFVEQGAEVAKSIALSALTVTSLQAEQQTREQAHVQTIIECVTTGIVPFLRRWCMAYRVICMDNAKSTERFRLFLENAKKTRG